MLLRRDLRPPALVVHFLPAGRLELLGRDLGPVVAFTVPLFVPYFDLLLSNHVVLKSSRLVEGPHGCSGFTSHLVSLQ